ncbi:MAG: hypothetical protein GY820_02715 [Gammaproteobacteria bacterium]|nr:hypothetical protein [Gammaproteobacteria bacterium]
MHQFINLRKTSSPTSMDGKEPPDKTERIHPPPFAAQETSQRTIEERRQALPFPMH